MDKDRTWNQQDRRNTWRSGPVSADDERRRYRDYRNREARDDWDIDWTGRPDADLFWSRGREYGRDSGFDRNPGRHGNRLDTGRQSEWNERPYSGSAFVIVEEWTVVGPFTGRGPRGYAGSDDRISDQVCERLTSHGRIDASGIEVQVNSGEVYLRGSVADRRMKRLAEDVAESVFGVRDVHNRLRVRQAVASGKAQRLDRNELRGRSEYLTTDADDIGRFNVNLRATVVDANERQVGTVKEIRPRELVVERPQKGDLRVPFGVVRYATGQRVVLNAIADDAVILEPGETGHLSVES